MAEDSTKLRSALQRIADMPLERRPGKPDPQLRIKRIALAALGATQANINKFTEHTR